MSVDTRQTEDLSTKNADWGTLVILLVVVIIGVVIATVTVKNRALPQPVMTLVNTPQAAAPAAPIPPTMPPASVVPEAGRANVPGMNPAGSAAPGGAVPETPSSSQAPGNGISAGTAAPGSTPGGPGGMGGAPNGSSAGPSGTAAAGG